MVVHHCARFSNNPRLIHKRAVIRIADCLGITPLYVHISDGTCHLSNHRVIYKPYKYRVIECNTNANLTGGWDQADAYNTGNIMSCT